MRLFLVFNLLLLLSQQANAAHYDFSQLFYPGSGGSVYGSFDVAATSGVVNQSQISNFSYSSLSNYQGGFITDLLITFDIDSKQLDIFLRTFEVSTEFVYDSGPDGPPTYVEVNIWHTYEAVDMGAGVLGSVSLSCSTFPPTDSLCGGRDYNIVTTEPIIVTQTPLPGALGLFTASLALIGIVQRRFKKS